jgi:hypothetical protein
MDALTGIRLQVEELEKRKELLQKLIREAKYIVLRHHPEFYPWFLTPEPSEGVWYEKPSLEMRAKNLFPVDRFEFREDGEWAQVYEIRKV